MKNYFIYLMKTKWLQTLMMALLPTIIFISIIIMSIDSYYVPDYPPTHSSSPDVFYFSSFFIMVIIPIVVVFRLYIFRNSKDVDLYYSLPISRQNLLLTQLLFGFLQIIVVWTSMYMIGLLVFTIFTDGYFYTSLLLLAYLVVIIYSIIIYTITSFLFLRANTIVDGIVFIVIFNTAFVFISAFLTHNYFAALDFRESSMFTPYYSMSQILKHLIYYSKPNPASTIAGLYGQKVGATIINTLLFLSLSIFGSLYSYKAIQKEKTEQIGRLSTSIFGYVSLIPLNLLFSTASVYFGLNRISTIAISVLASAGFIGFFIMRRSAKLKWIDILSVIIPIIIGIIIMSFVKY